MPPEAHVLVVDDDRQVTKATAAILENAGFTVSCALCGEEAMRLADESSPDLVLLDVVLGAENGIDLCRRIKDPSKPTRPGVILISAHRVSPDDHAVGLNAGADDYIGRPVSNRELIARVSAVARAARADAALRASEQRFRAIFKDAGVGMAVIDPESRILDANRALERMTRCSSETLSNRKLDLILRPEPTETETSPKGRIIEGTLIRGDGTTGWARWTQSCLGEIPGLTPQSVLIVEDVSERMALRAELVQAHKMEAVGRLAAGIAHEFNNLLMGIKGCAEIASEKLPPEEVAGQRIQDILRAAEKGAGLARQLLDFGRPRRTYETSIALDGVIQESLAIIRPMLGEDVKVTASLGLPGVTIPADGGQIQQILLNLAINARDAMPDGGTLRIATSDARPEAFSPRTNGTSPPIREGDHWVYLVIEDTGEGIEPENRDKVLEPFFTTKREGEGTGLGLTSVFSIVQQCGGHVTLESEPGMGTRVTITFPTSDQDSTDCGRGPSVAESPPRHATVLVVEDEPLVRMSVRHFLKEAGYRVLEADSPAAALRLLKEEKQALDLLLSDMVLPGGMDGRQLADHVRTTCPTVRTIYMSAYPEHLLLHQGRLRPGDVALQKPFEREVLLESVERALEA